ADGNLYGTTNAGPPSGVVYKVTPAGDFSVVYTFDNDYPWALMQGNDGDLYVTTFSVTTFCGSIVRLSTAGVLKATHTFNCGTAGADPYGVPIQAADGYIYGTTYGGGNFQGHGTVYKLNPATFQVTIIHYFGTVANDGAFPLAGLTEGTDGALYGATTFGGTEDGGALFKITPSGTYTLLYSFPFPPGPEAQRPSGAPMQHTNGAFYGTTQEGGDSFLGSIYKLNMGFGPFVAFVHPQGKVGTKAGILG